MGDLELFKKVLSQKRGDKGKAKIGTTTVSTPKLPLKGDTDYQRRKKHGKFRRRAAIEPVIGHLKKHFRMQQNYLGGKVGLIEFSLLRETRRLGPMNLKDIFFCNSYGGF